MATLGAARRGLVAVLLVATTSKTRGFPSEGSIVFTDSLSKRLLRLDADGTSHVLTHGLATYGGLIPWKGAMLAATTSHKVVQLDPWGRAANSSCGSNCLVDVPRAIGAQTVVDNFALGGMTLCGDDALFIVFGGNATTGHSGVLRCEGCQAGTDCTSKCAVVDGGHSPGKGMRQLGGYAAGVECVGDKVLVVDNTNFRVQAIPASCLRSPCNVSTFASKLNYPLGIAKVHDTILVSLDAAITSLSLDGSQQHAWSKQGDCGYLTPVGDRVLVADGDIVAFDSRCRGPACKPSVVWNATSGIKVYGAVAHVARAR